MRPVAWRRILHYSIAKQLLASLFELRHDSVSISLPWISVTHWRCFGKCALLTTISALFGRVSVWVRGWLVLLHHSEIARTGVGRWRIA